MGDVINLAPLKLKNAVIYRRETKSALDKLYRTPCDMKTAYNIGRILKHCDQNFSKLSQRFTELVQKYPERENVTGRFIDPEAEKQFEEMLNTEFELPKCQKIPIKIFENHPELLSAQELDALEPLLESFE